MPVRTKVAGVGRALRLILSGIRKAKESATGRVWDELHNAESRLTRAHEGRKSTFNRAAKKAQKKARSKSKKKSGE